MDEKKYLKRKEKASADGNREQLAASCNTLGDFYNQQGKYHNAVREYRQEADIYAKMGKRLEMAKAHRMAGEMFMLLSEFDNAKDHISIYLKTAKTLKNKVEEQRAYATLGRAHLLHGQSTSGESEGGASSTLEHLKQAEKAFLKSLLLIKELTGQISKLEQLDMQARCYLNIGVVKEHMEDFDESIAYIERAINISKSHDIFELTHLCYISMSLLYHCKTNDSTLALRYCNLALEVAKRLPNRVKKICETLITKSEILIKVGDFASAKQILTKAYRKNTPDENDRTIIEKSLRIVVKICQTLDELVTTSSVDYAKRKCLYERLGDGCCHLQSYTKALEYYQQMLANAQLNADTNRNLIPIYVSLYQTYKDNKQYDKALEYLWKEYDLNKEEPAEAFSTLCAIAEVCELQQQPFWTIQDIYQKAKDLIAKVDGKVQGKMQRIVYARLRKLQLKHKMSLMAEELEEEATSRGIDLSTLDDDSDAESDQIGSHEQNTPELGEDVCLDELTDSDMSDLDETDKPRPHRATRGTRCLAIKRNNKGETQLHQACISGNLELVRRLLDQGHVANVRDHAGWIPLHEACNHGFRDIVELLLDRGANVAINDKGGTSCDGITPLYDACSNGYLDVVELLLERGADATVKTDFGDTCISGLDKWRRSATLTEGEQAQYAQVRATLLKPLSKVGICSSNTSTQPLTNAHVRADSESAADGPDEGDDEPDDNGAIRRRTVRCRSEQNRSAEGAKAFRDSSRSLPRKPTATVEYKHVMQQLKRPNRLPSSLDDETYASFPSSASASCSTKQKRAALLDTEEVDDDTWLVDDVGPEKKKRRFQLATEPRAHAAAVQPSVSKESLHDSANFSLDTDLLPMESDAFQVMLDAATGVGTQQRQRQAQKLRLSRSSSISSSNSSASMLGRGKTKQQASLLDSGFCRFRSESPAYSEDSQDAYTALTHMRAIEPDSTTATPIHLLISPSKTSPIKVQATTQILSTTVSFKVKVEDELLLVPIERRKLNDINIRWLAEEAARRYYNLVGLKPVLRLKTPDGFAYEENDTVNVALEQNMILATVLEWKISPLAQRYEEMCHQLNTEIDGNVQAVLERAQVSNVIQFEGLWLTPPMTNAIFKAVLHQTNLRVLDLRNNFIQNEGCRQLARSLTTLKQLTTLNLQGNFITCEGVEALFAGPGVEKLSELEELNLSQNPIGNGSVRILDKFIATAGKSLQRLRLAQCGLTQCYDFDLGYYQLVEFDVSFNQLTDESFRKVLAKLNSCRLQSINLSYTKTPQDDERGHHGFADRIVEFFESGTCEKFKRIELCGCYLGDGHLYRIIQCLSKASDLELLDITDNAKLTPNALQHILDAVPQLRKLIAQNCVRLIDGERVQKLTQREHLPNFMALSLGEGAPPTVNTCELERCLRNLWLSHWGDKALVKSFAGGNLLLYVNDKDLYCH